MMNKGAQAVIGLICILLLLGVAFAAHAGDQIYYGARDNNNMVLKSQPFSVSSTTTIVQAVNGKKIKVFGLKLVTSATMSVAWRDGATNMIDGSGPVAANTNQIESVDPPAYLFSTSTGTSLDLVLTGATGTASGRVSYWSDDAL